uniref:LOW QUALITY PROTEIN: A-kinase anchor protein 5 n=1 Tax=Castor canadensis TaxID=51338 RepID=A0A8B7V5B2_CASCN|nr:LOW QUALITY PROTEIN: A-kinase anchor protein 5 [Castor canadensis]
METTVSEIQVENKDEKREVCPKVERQEGKTSMLCFKRRKKSAKALKPQAGSEAADARKCHPEAGTSDQPQHPEGTWASIKRLVTRRKRSESSKQQKSFEAEVQPEIKPKDADVSKKKAKSKLKIPCLKFPRGVQRSNRSKIIEDSDCSIKVQGEVEGLDIQTQTQLNDQATKAESTQDLSEGVSRKDDEVCESNVSNSIASGEEVISVELGLDNRHSAIHTETVILEEIDMIEEKPSVQQPQQASPLGSSETDSQHPVASDVPPSPAVPDEQIVEEMSNKILESEPNWKDDESREIPAEEDKPKDIELSQEDFKENATNSEKPKWEESKRMEPIAIIITDTEISEFDATKAKNVPKQFLISNESEQVGFFANDSDFEGRTSEQYETLLIETASSLVKNAIQLSIKQLVNEMASDDNKIQ